MMRAPAASAASMVAAWRVSAEMTAPSRASAPMTGRTLGDLLVRRDQGGVRARALAADIDDIGARRQHRPSGCDGGVGRRMHSAIGEGIGGDVENAHDQRAVEGEAGPGHGCVCHAPR